MTVQKYLFYVALALFLLPTSAHAIDTAADTDADGLTDNEEITRYFTNPQNADTDGDGFPDGIEIANGFSPHAGNRKKLLEVDSDNDGLSDSLEIILGTNLTKGDTDDDGIDDKKEVFTGFNPLIGNNNREVRRHAEVDLNTQKLHYFMNGIELGSFGVSSGKLQTPTPKGEFKVLRKVPVVHYIGPGYDLPNTKWNLEFKRTYYLHGAYWHKQFGIRPMSHGCVNIAYKDVEKLYQFLDVGDKVFVKGKTPTKPIKQVVAVKP